MQQRSGDHCRRITRHRTHRGLSQKHRPARSMPIPARSPAGSPGSTAPKAHGWVIARALPTPLPHQTWYCARCCRYCPGDRAPWPGSLPRGEGDHDPGIGCFFDDLTHRFVGFGGDRFQVFYHCTMGGAINDPPLLTDGALLGTSFAVPGTCSCLFRTAVLNGAGRRVPVFGIGFQWRFDRHEIGA